MRLVPSPHPGERLSALVDGELAEDERAAMEEHVRGCAECTERLEEMALLAVVAREHAPEAPSGYFDALPARVRERIESRPRTRRWPAWTWAVAAGLLLAVVTPLTLRHGPPLQAPLTAPAAPAAGTSGPESHSAGRGAANEEQRYARPADPPRPEAAGARRAESPAEAQAADAERQGDDEAGRLRARSEERLAEAPPATLDVHGPENATAAVPPSAPSAPSVADPGVPPATGRGGGFDALKMAKAAPAPPPTAAASTAPPVVPSVHSTAAAATRPADGFAREPRSESVEEAFESKEKSAGLRRPSFEADSGAQAGAPGAKELSDRGGALAEGALQRRDTAKTGDLAELRRRRERWRTLAKELGQGASADAARVQVVEAGVEAWRLGHEVVDRDQARRDGRAYLARTDAAQRARVSALLRSLDEAR